MTTTTHVRMTIDLTDADLDLDPEAMEDLTSKVVNEMSELVDNARLMRESEMPERGKPALAGFILGVLQAEVNLQNAKAVLDFLGERFYGKTLKLDFEANGKKYSLEYRDKQQLDEAIEAIEKLSKID